MPERAPYPFFVGCGRSGTTLVWAMFDAHPQMAMTPERHFPATPPPQWVRADGSFDRDLAVARITHRPWFRRYGIEPGAFAAAAAGERPPTYAGLMRTLGECYAASRGKPRYGNKTAGHVLVVPELAALFPEARFVHIVRDGRDVALSYLEKDFGPSDLRSAARFWRTRVERGRRAGAAMPERYLETRYEDLVDDPARELRRLCAFLDLPYDDAMLRYHEQPAAKERRRDPDHHLAKPPTKGLRDWRSQMSRADVLLFDSLAGDTLEAFGYERPAIPATAIDRVALRLGDARWRARRELERRRVSGAVIRRLSHA